MNKQWRVPKFNSCQAEAGQLSFVKRHEASASACRTCESDRNRHTMQAYDSPDDLKARYLPVVTAMVDRWAEGKALNPDSGRANGYYRMIGWLLNYVTENRELPKGIHGMPEGRDRHGRTEPSFPVDFDQVSEGFTLPE